MDPVQFDENEWCGAAHDRTQRGRAREFDASRGLIAAGACRERQSVARGGIVRRERTRATECATRALWVAALRQRARVRGVCRRLHRREPRRSSPRRYGARARADIGEQQREIRGQHGTDGVVERARVRRGVEQVRSGGREITGTPRGERTNGHRGDDGHR